MTDEKAFWFPVKLYGYGWGLPVRWQGWVALATYFALLFAGIFYFREPSLSAIAYVSGLTAVLIVIIVRKGERPLRWRWGKKM